MSTPKLISLLALGIFIISFTSMQNAEAVLCTAPDNAGTVFNPVSSCEYFHNADDSLKIIDGLPIGTTIEFEAALVQLELNGPPPAVPTIVNPGGSLGGETELDVGVLLLDVQGTGALAGFTRSMFMPVDVIADTAPRNAGDPIQSFATEMIALDGEIFGDPDFCELRIQAGSGFGLPSPGQTQLTDLGADFQVASFFDITYQIDFVGCPGSIIEGLAGTTQGTIRFLTQDLDGDGIPDGPGPNPVGGEIIPIESSSLILAGTQLTAAWLIPVLVSAVGIGLVLVRRK